MLSMPKQCISLYTCKFHTNQHETTSFSLAVPTHVFAVQCVLNESKAHKYACVHVYTTCDTRIS